jgi:hypothetical protein
MYAFMPDALRAEAVPSIAEAARANIAAYQSIRRTVFAAPALATLVAAVEQLAERSS